MTDLKQVGNWVYLVGEMKPTLGGSHFNLISQQSPIQEDVPHLSPKAPQVYQAIFEANRHRWIRSMHDLSEGGLAVSATEMCIGGRLGMEISLNTPDVVRTLFGETNGCLLVEVDAPFAKIFETHFASLPFVQLGKVIDSKRLVVFNQGREILSCSIDSMVSAWQKTRKG